MFAGLPTEDEEVVKGEEKVNQDNEVQSEKDSAEKEESSADDAAPTEAPSLDDFYASLE